MDISADHCLETLHNTRLTSIEQRPFQRIAKRLLFADSMILRNPASLPTPPPDATESEDADIVLKGADQRAHEAAEMRRKWKEEMLLDFDLLESSMIRIQLLHRSNELERERYAQEKIKITEQTQRIKENTIQLRQKLEEAQQTLKLRKEYDELTEKILANRMLRPREDSHAQLDKLNNEIAELEQESNEYAQTWRERQEQFGRIVDAGKDMLRMIRDEKEEAERKEGMEEADDAATGEQDGASTKGAISAIGTPRPHDNDGGATPLTALKEAEDTPASREESLLKPMATPLSISRAASPARTDAASQIEDSKDIEMEDLSTQAEVVDSEIEEGEEQEDDPNDNADSMET